MTNLSIMVILSSKNNMFLKLGYEMTASWDGLKIIRYCENLDLNTLAHEAQFDMEEDSNVMNLLG